VHCLDCARTVAWNVIDAFFVYVSDKVRYEFIVVLVPRASVVHSENIFLIVETAKNRYSRMIFDSGLRILVRGHPVKTLILGT